MELCIADIRNGCCPNSAGRKCVQRAGGGLAHHPQQPLISQGTGLLAFRNPSVNPQSDADVITQQSGCKLHWTAAKVKAGVLSIVSTEGCIPCRAQQACRSRRGAAAFLCFPSELPAVLMLCWQVCDGREMDVTVSVLKSTTGMQEQKKGCCFLCCPSELPAVCFCCAG
eukprot:1138014-Pelagomonas_calceolata.AAC.3